MLRIMLVALLLLAAPAQADQLLYVSCTKDKRIEVHRIAAATGKLTRHSVLELERMPGPMAATVDGRRIYLAAVRRQNRNRTTEILTLERIRGGGLKLLKAQRVASRATYLRVAPGGKFLLTAHYGSGQVVVYRITDGICTGEVVDRHKTQLTAHCIELDRSGAFAFVPHTTPNKIYQFRFDASRGLLRANTPAFVDGPDDQHQYHQPRHIKLHPTLSMAYSSNERGGGISAWRLFAATGKLTRTQTLATLPQDFKGKSAAAEIQLTPNGRFAYVSNRDLARTADGADTIAGFAIDAVGKLSLIGHTATARFPRSFTIDRTGAYLYAAGQRAASVAAYRIAAKTGKLVPIAVYRVGQLPSWVMCLPND